MLDTNLIPREIYDAILQSLPRHYGEEDISTMTACMALDAYLSYNGIIGWSSKIIDVWKVLMAAQEATVPPPIPIKQKFSPEQCQAAVELLWGYLLKDAEHKDRKQTGWGTKTIDGLIGCLERIAYDTERSLPRGNKS